jgi:nucleotide-binding universal stress UspA family protein
MKTILITLDYDPTAQKVAETGYAIAHEMHAKVCLLHVISDTVYYASRDYSPIMGFNGFMDLGTIQKDTTEALSKASNHYLDKVRLHLGDDTITTMVLEGDFAECILKAAREKSADIIVIGSHSQKWLEKIVVGSVTEQVLNHSTIPVLVVPTRKRKS